MVETGTGELNRDDESFSFVDLETAEEANEVLEAADEAERQILRDAEGNTVAAGIGTAIFMSLSARYNFVAVEVGIPISLPDIPILGTGYHKPFVGMLSKLATIPDTPLDRPLTPIDTMADTLDVTMASLAKEEWLEVDADILFENTKREIHSSVTEATEFLLENKTDTPGPAFRKLNKACRLTGEAIALEAAAPYQARGEHLPIKFFNTQLIRDFIDMDYWKHAHNLLRVQGNRNIGKWLRWLIDENHYWNYEAGTE